MDWNRLTDDGSTYSATKVYFFPNNFRSIDNLWYKEEPKVEHSFIATILEINGSSVTVQPVENSAILMSSDKVSFGTADLEKIDAEVGSVVKVIYTSTWQPRRVCAHCRLAIRCIRAVSRAISALATWLTTRVRFGYG